MEKKCDGNCGLSYCDEYGCIENKPPGDNSHLLVKPESTAPQAEGDWREEFEKSLQTAYFETAKEAVKWVDRHVVTPLTSKIEELNDENRELEKQNDVQQFAINKLEEKIEEMRKELERIKELSKDNGSNPIFSIHEIATAALQTPNP